jgi:CubicO group peptidase (beta-lactamase class C family)
MYSAVSQAIEMVTGAGLGVFMRDKIWQPLGMNNTFWTPQEALDAASEEGTVLAQGYAWHVSSESFVEEPRPDFPGVSGAGAMISTVSDYSKWLRCMISQSLPISKAAHRELITPRINYSNHGLNPFSGTHAYCLGWILDYYRGE